MQRNLQLADLALSQDRFDDAITHAEAVLDVDSDNTVALLIRTRGYLFGDPPKPDAATQDLERVLNLEPENLHARELDLWRDYRYGSSFLLPFRTSDRLRRARDLIEADSTRRLAHLVAGLIRYSDFRDSYETVRFRSFTSPGRAVGVDDRITDAAAWMFDTRVDVGDGEPELSFRDPSVTGYTMDYTPLSDAEQEFAREAVKHLEAAAGPDIVGTTAHRYLAEILVRTGAVREGERLSSRLVNSNPDVAEGWMIRGMFRARSGDWSGADHDFAAAFERVSESTRRAMTTPQLFTEDAESGGPDDFWLERDPLWSTDENEALLEHVARMVEADLLYGDPAMETRGWNSDAGGVLVRYGPPLVTARYSSLTEGYLLLHYGDRRFMFMMPGRRGSYTFYSPSATAFQGGRSNIRQWQSDQEIAAREAFREEPRRSAVLDDRRVRVSAISSRFGGESPALAVAWCLHAEQTATSVDEAALFALSESAQRPERIAVESDPVPSGAGSPECPAHVLEAPPPHGPTRYSLEIRAGKNVGVTRFAVDPEKMPAGVMSMSDLLPASLVVERAATDDDDAAGAALSRPGHDIHPVGLATFERGRNLYLYFELYDTGASRTQPLAARVQAALVPDDGSEAPADDDAGRLERLLSGVFNRSDSAPVSVDFEEPISESDVYRYLILRTDDLDPGRYIVAVRISTPTTGRTVQSTRTIEITEND